MLSRADLIIGHQLFCVILEWVQPKSNLWSYCQLPDRYVCWNDLLAFYCGSSLFTVLYSICCLPHLSGAWKLWGSTLTHLSPSNQLVAKPYLINIGKELRVLSFFRISISYKNYSSGCWIDTLTSELPPLWSIIHKFSKVIFFKTE